MTGFIAVHCGAGFHKHSLRSKYKKLCREACQAGARILNAGGSAMLACQTAVMILENSPLTNAGYGSSLSISGQVECDASIMDGETLNFGACGAVKGVKFPISLASQICMDQLIPKPLHMIPPTLLVGSGATAYAKKSNLALIDNEKLISKKARRHYNRARECLDNFAETSEIKDTVLDVNNMKGSVVILHNGIGGDTGKNDTVTESVDSQSKSDDISMEHSLYDRLDTVGAVCVDSRGHVASACSSGGISMKYDGRVGQAATYACGVWADSKENTSQTSVAVSTTGAGEYIIKTLLARELGTKIKNANCPAHAFLKCMKEDFLESKFLANATYKIGGALILCVYPTGQGELLWGHTSRTMGIAYMDTSQKISESTFSELPLPKEGHSITMSAVKFNIKPSS